MIHFVKNTGQFDPRIAWISNVPEELKGSYRGEGLVTLTPGEKPGEFVDFSYVEDVALFDPETGGFAHNGVNLTGEELESAPLFEARVGNVATAIASCYQLLVEHGTGTAAILNLAVHGTD